MNLKSRNIIVVSLVALGITCMGTGVYAMSLEPKEKESIEKKEIALNETLTITLKEPIIKVNQPLSVTKSDYITEFVEPAIIEEMLLDTSKVDITKAGIYPYTITYKKQVFQGKITVEEEIAPQEAAVIKITLKTLTLKKGQALPIDVSDYVVEPLTDEMKKQMNLALPYGNITTIAGTYQYTIAYNGTVYTGNITVVEDQPTSTPATKVEEDKSPSEEINKNDTKDTTDTTTNVTP